MYCHHLRWGRLYVGEVGLGVENQECSSGQVHFEMPVRHQSGDGEEADGYTSLEFGERSDLGVYGRLDN